MLADGGPELDPTLYCQVTGLEDSGCQMVTISLYEPCLQKLFSTPKLTEKWGILKSQNKLCALIVGEKAFLNRRLCVADFDLTLSL